MTIAHLGFDGASELVRFLDEHGASGIGHSRRTFMTHLAGTAKILERWGARAAVCKAGLFHSIYGTERFHHALLSFEERPNIKLLLGEEAERLAYVFCAMDRRSIYTAIDRGEPYALTAAQDGSKIPVSAVELRDLVWLKYANDLEQTFPDMLTSATKVRSRRALSKCLALLPDVAVTELEQVYGPVRDGQDSGLPGIATLLDVPSPKPFATERFPHELHVAHGGVERLTGLVDLEFDALLKQKGGKAHASVRTLDGADTELETQTGQERALYDGGFALHFHDLASPSLAEWAEAIHSDLELGPAAIRFGAIATRRGHVLGPRYDAACVFVCQGRGATRWRIAPNTHVRNPTIGYALGGRILATHRVEAPDGFPTEMPAEHQIIDMAPGSVLFIPAGMWRSAETVDVESVVVSVQISLTTWRDAIEYLLTRTSALLGEELRAPVLRGFHAPDAFHSELKTKMQAVLGTLSEADIKLRYDTLQHFVASRTK